MLFSKSNMKNLFFIVILKIGTTISLQAEDIQVESHASILLLVKVWKRSFIWIF